MVKHKTAIQPGGSDSIVRATRPAELSAISALHAEAFGPGRFARTAYRLREGTKNCSAHCRSSWRGDLLTGAVTLTEVTVGRAPTSHWLLGPLAVRPGDTNKGLGRRLVGEALQSVAEADEAATVLLVGDLDYYGQLGFEAVPARRITLPGPVDPSRLLIWRGPDGSRALPSGAVRAHMG